MRNLTNVIELISFHLRSHGYIAPKLTDIATIAYVNFGYLKLTPNEIRAIYAQIGG